VSFKIASLFLFFLSIMHYFFTASLFYFLSIFRSAFHFHWFHISFFIDFSIISTFSFWFRRMWASLFIFRRRGLFISFSHYFIIDLLSASFQSRFFSFTSCLFRYFDLFFFIFTFRFMMIDIYSLIIADYRFHFRWVSFIFRIDILSFQDQSR